MRRKFRVVESKNWSIEDLQIGMIRTYDELMEGFNISLENWDGSVENLNQLLEDNYKGRRYKLTFEEVKEPTLIEKIANHFGVAIGEKFNLFWGGDQKILKEGSPHRFNNEFICNSYDHWDFSAMNRIICGDLLIEKIPVKSAKDIAIEEAEKRLEEAQEALKKAKEME